MTYITFMTDPKNQMHFPDAKNAVIENLQALQFNLTRAVDQGMLDDDSNYDNLILTLIDDVEIVDSWPELAEIIFKGKTLEADIDTWLSFHGITTIGLEWPGESP
jgi:hypothetical protein